MKRVHPVRAPWDDVPDVVIVAPIPEVKGHPDYDASKAGDADAAVRLVSDTLDPRAVDTVRSWATSDPPILLPVHALEDTGVNAIPLALAEELGRRLGWPVSTSVVQMNVVVHTGASGYARLARQALFDGGVQSGVDHVLVDDFIGQGGTLANLRATSWRAADGSSVPSRSRASYTRRSWRSRTRRAPICGGSMDPNSKAGGKTGSVTPSTASLNQKAGISHGPRMLSASEISLLKQSAKEIAARIESRRT